MKSSSPKPSATPLNNCYATQLPEGSPKRFCLIGHPLGHSLSPAIHAYILHHVGLVGTYSLEDIAPANLQADYLKLIRSFDGFNCTIPHKKSLIPLVESLDASATLCGAVNTVYQNVGYNTDIRGFLASGIDLNARNVLLLSTGGTSRMMAAACLQAGARSLTIRGRSLEKLESFRLELLAYNASTRIYIETAPNTPEADYDVILNGTPLGMWPNAGGIPCETSLLKPGVTVFDAIYNPISTRLVLNARKNGAHAIGGLRMLIRQAIEAQRIWNPSITFDADAIERALIPQLVSKLLSDYPIKILLTGFMGAGKSTVGRHVAQLLDIPFIDLDDAIVTHAGCPIADIFAASGESAFRALERSVAEYILCHQGPAVIATGGGFPILPKNQTPIRKTNTLVFNLDIPFDSAWQRITNDTQSTRPLATERTAAFTRYCERENLYRSFCDYNLTTNKTPEAVAQTLVQVLTNIG